MEIIGMETKKGVDGQIKIKGEVDDFLDVSKDNVLYIWSFETKSEADPVCFKISARSYDRIQPKNIDVELIWEFCLTDSIEKGTFIHGVNHLLVDPHIVYVVEGKIENWEIEIVEGMRTLEFTGVVEKEGKIRKSQWKVSLCEH